MVLCDQISGGYQHSFQRISIDLKSWQEAHPGREIVNVQLLIGAPMFTSGSYLLIFYREILQSPS